MSLAIRSYFTLLEASVFWYLPPPRPSLLIFWLWEPKRFFGSVVPNLPPILRDYVKVPILST